MCVHEIVRACETVFMCVHVKGVQQLCLEIEREREREREREIVRACETVFIGVTGFRGSCGSVAPGYNSCA
jgi:hypothetical protein